MSTHRYLTGEDVHTVVAYIFADEAARNLINNPNTGVAYKPDEIGRVAQQSDTEKYWILKTTTPTWSSLSGSDGLTGADGNAGETIFTSDGIITDESRTITSATTGSGYDTFSVISQNDDNKKTTFKQSVLAASITTNFGGYLYLDAFDTELATKFFKRSGVRLDSESVKLVSNTGNGRGYDDSRVELNVSQDNSVLITDLTNSKGAAYAADYSTNFTDRSLVDRAFVESAILSHTTSTAYTGIDGILIDGTEFSIDRLSETDVQILVVSGATHSLSGEYVPSTFSGTYNFITNVVNANSDYKVFKKYIGSGNWDIVMYNTYSTNMWVAAKSNKDPDTLIDGDHAGITGSYEQDIATTSSTKDGQNVPSHSSSDIDYITNILPSFISFTDNQISVKVINEDDMASDSEYHIPTQQSVKACKPNPLRN